jgi:hypothetical protein
MFNVNPMTDRQVLELAAILVNDRGKGAVRLARKRRAQHPPRSEPYRLWSRIVAATLQLLLRRQSEDSC